MIRKLDCLAEGNNIAREILYDSEHITATEAARRLGVSPSTVDRFRRDRGIPTQRDLRQQEHQRDETYQEWFWDLRTQEWTKTT